MLKAEDAVQSKKKEIRHLVAKMKHAVSEREEAEKYEKLHSQYVCALIILSSKVLFQSHTLCFH